MRKKFIAVQPEEMVRQLILAYFIENKIYPTSRLAVEKNVKIDGRIKRFDILIFDTLGSPFLLVECKSFDKEIGEKAIRQAALYNIKLKAPFLCVSNGKTTKLFQIDFDMGNVIEVFEWPR